jgi:hypothetical protein
VFVGDGEGMDMCACKVEVCKADEADCLPLTPLVASPPLPSHQLLGLICTTACVGRQNDALGFCFGKDGQTESKE